MRMNETINTMPEYERLRADYEKRLQEVEQNYQKQLIQMADEAKRANMAKIDFLRRMSHDMRTPINAINGYVRIAGAFPDDQDTDGVGIFAGDDQKCVGYEQAGIR